MVHVQCVHPIVIADHGRGRESPGTPFFQIGIDLRGSLVEDLFGAEQLAVVLEPVDPIPKPRLFSSSSRPTSTISVAFRHEVERGTETHPLFNIGKFEDVVVALGVSTSWESTRANCFPSGQPGQPSGGLAALGSIGQM